MDLILDDGLQILDWFDKFACCLKEKTGIVSKVAGSRQLGLHHNKSDIDIAIITNSNDWTDEISMNTLSNFYLFLRDYFDLEEQEITTMTTKAGILLCFAYVKCDVHPSGRIKIDATIRSLNLHESITNFMKTTSDNLFPTIDDKNKYRKEVFEAYHNKDKYAKCKSWQKQYKFINK